VLYVKQRTPKFYVFALLIIAMGTYAVISGKVQKQSSVKSSEEYWAETGLEPQALEALLQDKSCQSSERYFLACANAVLSVAQKYDFDVALDGSVVPFSKSSLNQILTEKELMAPWKAFISAHKTLPLFPFLEIWKELSTKHIKTGHLSYAVGLGMNGFLSVFKDPHTYLLPAEFYNNVVAKTNNKSLSIGLVIGRDDKNYFVKKVLEDSSSSVAGMKKGDILVSLQGRAAAAMTTFQLGDVLRGEEGSTLKIEILRKGQPLSLTIYRTEKTIPTVSSQILEGIKPVGVITINKFAVDTCTLTKATLQNLELQHVQGLLLDLRDNPGGQMEEAACVASLFLGPGKKIFEVKTLDTTVENEIVYGQENQAYAGSMAVLINSGSASASEIVAGALQFYKRAVLVGERSFGKGSFQEGEIWSNNDKIAIFETKGFYYLPSGQTPQLVGLEPDVVVNFKDRFALREQDQYLNPLRPAAQPGPKIPPLSAQNTAAKILGCVSFESDLLPSEDPEMKEAHRVVSCR
jgi:carboxyl-terminal processing protease